MNMELLAGDIEKRQLSSLLKILAVLVLKLRGQRIKDDLKPIADTQLKDAKSFLKKMGCDLSLFDNMYTNILKKSDTVYPLAEAFVKDFRKQIRIKNLANDIDSLTVKNKEVMGFILTLISSPDSASAYSSLQRKISNLGDTNITKRFIELHTETGQSPNAIRKQIEALVLKLVGRKNSMALTAEENKKYVDNDDKKMISKLRSSYSEAVRQTVKQIVLDSGEPRLPVSRIIKNLNDSGTGVTPYPTAFTKSKHIYVNLDAQMCNVKGDILNQKSLSPTFTFELNPDYDPEYDPNNPDTVRSKKKGWVYKVTNPETGVSNYIGTVVKSSTAKGAKFDKLDDIQNSGELENLKKKWRVGLTSKEFEKFETVASYLTEYLYVTSSRIGSEEKGGNTGGITTFGASNFPVSSVKVPRDGSVPAKLKIEYFVKGGHKETFILDPAKAEPDDRVPVTKLIAFIIAKTKGKKPTDPVFTVGPKRIQVTAYTNWLKEHTTLTGHNFRTLRGSSIFLKMEPSLIAAVKRAITAAKPKKVADKTVHDLFKETMTRVGKALGHIRRNKEGVEESTASTAISFYCNPVNMLAFYKKVGVAPPSPVVAAARRANIDI